jgi:hypothetical protein
MGQKVMLDRDLAKLYEVETRVLKQSVKRNITRFPEDFMFEMSKEEFQQGLRYIPFCFTEQGVAMLSSILNSERAIMSTYRSFVFLPNYGKCCLIILI